jgi:transcriptional regulator with XRE-family HTH domain
MLTSVFLCARFQNMNSTHYDPIKLKDAREKKFTQKQLAEKLGVTEMTIYRAETGQNVSFELLSDICSEVGLDVKKILLPTSGKNFCLAS